ncbi:MAG TPA: TadE/TadG family type IV pilus assembly protein [Anaerolineales bacterium]
MDEESGNPISEKASDGAGQGMVEFVIILPVLLLLILGIVEFGRLLTAISSVSTASRDAARYAVSVGETSAGTPHYQDCLGIREAAHKVAVFVDPFILITYDVDGPGGTAPVEYCQVGKTTDPVQVPLGTQISVTVTDVFEPLVPIVNLPTIPIASETARTVLRDVYIK